MTRPRSLLVLATFLTTVLAGLSAGLLTGPATAGPVTTRASAKHHKPHVHWQSKSLVVGSPVVASGVVPGGKRKVLMQVAVKGSGWRTIKSDHSSRSGRFRLHGKLDWYGIHKVRVLAPGRHAFHRATKIGVFAGYTLRGNAADHALISDQGRNFMFNPCRPVRYLVNDSEVGPNGLALAQYAVASAGLATGIRTKYVGSTSIIPLAQRLKHLPHHASLVIGFANESEVPTFGSDNAVGIERTDRAVLARTRNGHGHEVWQSTAAGVTIDATQYANTALYDQGTFGSKPTMGQIMLHEVGHAFGLDHTPAADEIMYPSANWFPYPGGVQASLYGFGDLTGLKKSGLDQGCLRVVRRAGRTATGERTSTRTFTQLPGIE